MSDFVHKHIAIDTNILVRLFVADDETQHQKVVDVLEKVDSFFVPTTVFVETVWVLSQRYDLSKADVLAVLSDFIENSEKLVHADDIFAGLDMLKIGGDFADMINAHSAKQHHYQPFVTFDKKASQKLNQLNYETLLL